MALRAKGTLIYEPRFSYPCEMQFFPSDTGRMATFEANPLKMAIFPMSRGKNRQEKSSAEIRGEFFRTISQVNFAVGFFGDELAFFARFLPFSTFSGGSDEHLKIQKPQEDLGMTSTRFTRVSLVTRVWRRSFWGPFQP